MSTPPSATARSEFPVNQEPREIKIVSHSHLFYWWPVWAVGFLMALLTLIDGHRMVVVPGNSTVERGAQDTVKLPAGAKLSDQYVQKEHTDTLKLHAADKPAHGVIFAITLILVILITNVPLRGLWSVVVIIIVVLGTIIFALAGWWTTILEIFYLLDIRINMGGYLFISSLLFLIWLITLLFFDRQTYLVFTPGQLKVCTMIGGGEKAYDTQGMTISKQRSDLFRHWILGIGSGDLIVNTTGAHVEQFDWPNVLFIGTKVHKIERMLREKSIVEGR